MPDDQLKYEGAITKDGKYLRVETEMKDGYFIASFRLDKGQTADKKLLLQEHAARLAKYEETKTIKI